jgi:hypothetical protein
MDQRATNADDSGAEEPVRDSAPAPTRMSRRDFASRFGAGSAAVVGLAWASPHISTIRFARKAAVGSPSPTGSSTTTSTTIAGTEAHMSLSSRTPCAGDIIEVRADGFVPKTAVTLELDSDENTLGVTTAGVKGRINVTVRLPSDITGPHVLIVTGVRPGGRTLTLSVPVTIKTEEECHVGPEGSTTTSTTQPGPTTTISGKKASTSTTPTSAPTSTSIGGETQHEGGGGVHGASNGGGFLAFTGTDSVDLALLGAAAAVGGRALFGLVAHRDEDDEDEE